MIEVTPARLRHWISVLYYEPNPEIIIPEMQALLAEAGEPELVDEDEEL